MPKYRIYMLTEANKFAGPSQDVTCEDDQQAVLQAKQLLGHALEVWQGARLVTRLRASEARSHRP